MFVFFIQKASINNHKYQNISVRDVLPPIQDHLQYVTPSIRLF